MKNPNFMINLLNTLKNDRRLQILEIISKGRHSLTKLQQELKKVGYYHSTNTIDKEYLAPLMEAGLAEENQNQYYLTQFGCRLNDIVKDFRNMGEILPPHSECYEEMALSMLLNEPKAYEDFEGTIPTKSVARVLTRLQNAKLIETSKENDYIFFFKTKRDPGRTTLSPTERKVYENIPVDGISARKLREKARISLRRTYKYLRRLKGKKLVFTRKRPKSYALTPKGLQTALVLKRIQDLALETYATTAQTITTEETREWLIFNNYQKNEKKVKKIIPLTTIKAYYLA